MISVEQTPFKKMTIAFRLLSKDILSLRLQPRSRVFGSSACSKVKLVKKLHISSLCMYQKSTSSQNQENQSKNILNDKNNSIYQRLRMKYPNSKPASLIGSFLVLHELTAIIPLLGIFWILYYTETGEKVLDLLGIDFESVKEVNTLTERSTSDFGDHEGRLWNRKLSEWSNEGLRRVYKLANRYGYLIKESDTDNITTLHENTTTSPEGTDHTIRQEVWKATTNPKNAAVIADGLAAYLIVKALLPFRIALSMYLAPILANSVAGRLKVLASLGRRSQSRAAKP